MLHPPCLLMSLSILLNCKFETIIVGGSMASFHKNLDNVDITLNKEASSNPKWILKDEQGSKAKRTGKGCEEKYLILNVGDGEAESKSNCL